MNQYKKIYNHIISLEEDFEKFYDKGNKAAGTRVRKGMQDLKNLAQEIRIEVQNMKTTDK
ncbi:MAG: histone H1 [Roseivirga sp.]